jgi:hypothetical protein
MRLSSKHAQDPAGDRARWLRWRRQRLQSAGFPDDLAELLAAQRSVDLHALLELVDSGCPPHLAARILAPLDEEDLGDERDH